MHNTIQKTQDGFIIIELMPVIIGILEPIAVPQYFARIDYEDSNRGWRPEK